MDEHQIRHLEMVQRVVDRLARTSFLIKGWALTLCVATFGVALDQGEALLGLLGMLALAVFWVLDAYYLHRERCFRRLHAWLTRESGGKEHLGSFQMDYNLPGKSCLPSPVRTAISLTQSFFYGPLLAIGLGLALTLFTIK